MQLIFSFFIFYFIFLLQRLSLVKKKGSAYMLSLPFTSQHFVSTNKSSFISSIVRSLIYVWTAFFFHVRWHSYLFACNVKSSLYSIIISIRDSKKKREGQNHLIFKIRNWFRTRERESDDNFNASFEIFGE